MFRAAHMLRQSRGAASSLLRSRVLLHSSSSSQAALFSRPLPSSPSPFALRALSTLNKPLSPLHTKDHSSSPSLSFSPNEAATVAASARLLHSTRPMAASDMATHWNMEKLVTFGVIGLLPACAVASGTAPLLDTALGVAVVVHGHWGLECILTDYVHGQGPETVAKVGTYVFSAASLLAVSYFNMHDVGLVEAVKLLWTL